MNNSAIMEALICAKELLILCLDGDADITTEHIHQVIAKVDKALSAPTRNCDVPLVVDGPADNNADKAWLVFKKHNPDAYFDVPGLLRCIDWLLSPVTERKGETDGK